MNSKGILPAFLGMIACFQSLSQFNFSFNDIRLDSALIQIENSTNKSFYFDTDWLKDYRITDNISEKTLEAVLGKLLDPTSIQYVFIDDKFILTNNAPIVTNLITEETEKPDLEYLFEREYDDVGSQVVIVGEKSKMEVGSESILAGFVRSKDSGEPIIGAIVYQESTGENAVTNNEGFYSLSLPSGQNEISIKFSGFRRLDQKIVLFSDGTLDFQLEQEAILLEEVFVYADADENIKSVKLGSNALNMEEVKNVPKVLGESDLVQIALTLPGVQNIGEGSAGINVRGGKTDQNLILYNNATIYNPSHFFGFFSAFNTDITGQTELYKSSMPVNYGGRLSSLLDVKTKVGDKEKFGGKIGISPVTTQASLEIPIIKSKTSATIGLRTTYSDWILDGIENASIRNSDPSFLDFTTGIHHSYGNNSELSASVYYSSDRFKLSTDSLYSYFNFNTAVNWSHSINQKLTLHTATAISQYSFDIDYDAVPQGSFNYGFEIQDIFGQARLNYYPNEQHDIQVGFDVKHYELSPGFINPLEPESEVLPRSIEEEQGIETAFFLSDRYSINNDITLYGGLRYSTFSALGNRLINFYDSEIPRNENSITSTQAFDDGEVINTYHGPEFRFSLRYALNNTSSLKAGFTQTRQYIHALSNNVSISPTDTWKLSDPNFAPQLAKQYSIGYFRNFASNAIEVSLETYYKTLDNLLDYKVGADLILNPLLETDVIQGEGRAYGVELLLRKNIGKLNGWLSYTYSRSQQRFDSQFLEETINNGNYFPTNFEKPHDVSLISNYKLNRRLSFSLNVNYSTGRPVTYPTAIYQLGGTEIVHFSDRNQFRLPNYFRVDLSVNLEGSHRVRKIGHGYWSFSVYNLTGRDNVFSVFFANNDGEIQGYELSVLGNAIPSITYNVTF